MIVIDPNLKFLIISCKQTEFALVVSSYRRVVLFFLEFIEHCRSTWIHNNIFLTFTKAQDFYLSFVPDYGPVDCGW